MGRGRRPAPGRSPWRRGGDNIYDAASDAANGDPLLLHQGSFGRVGIVGSLPEVTPGTFGEPRHQDRVVVRLAPDGAFRWNTERDGPTEEGSVGPDRGSLVTVDTLGLLQVDGDGSPVLGGRCTWVWALDGADRSGF